MGLFFGSRAAPPAATTRGIALPGRQGVALGTPSYNAVDVTAGETALQSVAVRSAVHLLCGLTSNLPIDVFSGKGTARKAITKPGYLEDPAGDGYGLVDWSYQYLASLILRGNAFGDVLARNAQGGYPTQVALYHPDNVRGRVDDRGRIQWSIGGRPVDNPADLLHRRAFPVPGRVLGLSVIEQHAAQIGLSLTTTRFGLQWFQDGAHPGGLLTNELEDLNDTDGTKTRTIKDKFMAALRGTREPVVMGKGWKYQSIQVAPEESQFLETQGWTAAECARIFGPGVAEVLGYTASGGGGSLTYTNRVDRNADLLTLTLNQWIRALERVLSDMLPKPQYVRIDRDALLEMTTLDRYRAYEIALRNGFRVIDEVRDDEDEGPVPWGKKPFTLPKSATDDGTTKPADEEKDKAQ
ncbi:phage portal protein [Actinoplanes oblitus]|uniref:Phage portal protein n=1 Tax=Actinoplanes oblitus TaxID=3040509 RepID=A0ABY8WME5_9ACTN|nr:phage portal protein [Actinoplanes oblitus]WIM97693.1 phage portal protein [Actinoplanes oblitus]